MSATWAILFLMIVVPVGLAMLIGAIVLLVRGSSTTRWIIGGVAFVLLLLAILVGLWGTSVRQVQHATVVQRHEIEQQQAAIEDYNRQEQERRHREAHAAAGEQLVEIHEQAQRGIGGRETWRHASDHFLVADHYPSAAAAARGLAVEIEPLLDTGHRTDDAPFAVTIITTDRIHQSVAEAMADVLRERNSRLEVSTGERNIGPRDTGITLGIGGKYQFATGADLVDGQVLSAKVSGPEGTQTRSAPWVDKSWVEDFNAFVSAGDRGTYILAQSTEPALHSGEAQAMAISDAAQQLTVHAQARLLGEARYGSINATRLYQQTVVALNEGRFIEDRFVQAFERPGGKVYQAWLLIEPDPGVLDEMAREQFTAAQHLRNRYFSSAGGAVVMLIVVLVLYAFLNAATRGYYATGLKFAAATVVVLGVVWLVLIT